MKVKLFGLAALILLSAISGIFTNMPIIGISAQDYEPIDDDSSYGNNNNNGMLESYSYEDPNMYNTDNNGYNNNNFDPSIDEQNPEYSSYDSYGPPNYGGDGNAEEYSSYDNYEYSSDSGYMDNNYPIDDPGLYENQYNNYNEEEEDSYDTNYYPPKKPEKFTCPDSGLVVDEPENCPIICPFGSTLAGHFVAAGSNLTQICNVDQQLLETCPAGTDLEGVFVTDATAEQCNIFATCDANTPLGEALGLNATGTVEVADPQLCQLSVPTPVQIFQCPTDPVTNPSLNPLLAGANVTDLDLCNVATPAVQCGDGTTLDGVWIHPDEVATCNIDIPPPIPTFQCLPTDPLANAIVTDERLCQFEDIDLFTCPVEGSNPALVGANVTDLRLCQAPITANICGIGTDLEGVFVNNTATDCIIDIDISVNLTRNLQAQCLKCADLAVFAAGPNVAALETAASQLRGSTTGNTNIFTACEEANPRTAFNTLVTSTATEAAFDTCLDNAGRNPGNVTSTSSLLQAQALSSQESILQMQASSLQENSLTTNVKPEAEIPTFSNQMSPPLFSPPTIAQGTIAQGTEDPSSALAKTEKLKKQWLDLLP